MTSSKKNYLENVILRFDFKDEVIIPDEIITKVVDSFSSQFIHESLERLDVNIILDQGKLSAKNKVIKTHEFNDKSGFKISLEPRFISFNTQNYSGYKEFMNIVKSFIALLQIGNEELKRLGLRYINHIKITEGDPYNWDGFIITELTQIKNFVNSDEIKYLTRNMGDIWFKKTVEDLDFSMHFIYGWANSEFPNPIAKKEFVLDYDCYTENEFNINETSKYIDIFHSEIKKMFTNSIDSELKKEMGEEKLWTV